MAEQHEQAVSELKECLEVQSSVLEKDDRLLAETHYQLGMAHFSDYHYDDAIECYKNAINVLQLKQGMECRFSLQ